MLETGILMGPDPVYEPAPGGLGYEIYRALKLHKGKQIQHMIETGETLSYDDLLVRSVRTAIYLTKKNLKKDDIILLCSGNNHNAIVPLIASKFIDVQFAAMDASLPIEEAVHLLNLLEPKVIFIAEDTITKFEEETIEKLNFQFDLISLGSSSKKYTNITDLFHPVDGEENYRPSFVQDIMETAAILPSSGTTGKPKGICLNHYSLLAQTYILCSKFFRKGTITFSNFSEEFSSEDDLSLLHYSPLYWVSGFHFYMVQMFCGGQVLLGTCFDAKVAWNAADKYQPDNILLPPGQVNELCTYGFPYKPITNVKCFGTGGGLVSTSHMRDIKRCFPNAKVIQLYGQTENSGLVTTFNRGIPEELEYQEKHLDSCGRPVDGYRMKVVDIDTGRMCGPGEQGELLVKNKNIMNGYFKMDSSSAFDEEGWFKTGDLVYFDTNGYLYILDRIKDRLLYRLYNITPSVIENILRQHPAVYECCVVGIRHLRDNEHPMGIVVLRKDCAAVTEEEIVSFVNERVESDKYKIRAGIKFVKEMLKTTTGKLRKIEMKRRIAEGIPF